MSSDAVYPSPVPLYPADIKGCGTAHVQNLTSLICNIAASHRRSPRSMLALIAERFGFDTVRVDEGTDVSINACGLTQRSMVAAIARAYKMPEVYQTTLGQLAPSLGWKSGRVVKPARHWCPNCYRRMRDDGHEAYDLLIWQVVDISMCPICRARLVSACGKCGVSQPTLPFSGTLDLCGRCGTWLGQHLPAQDELSAESLAYQQWLIPAIEQLLLCRDQVAPYLSGREQACFLREMAKSRGISTAELAKQVRVPVDTVLQWTRGRMQPTLTSWLRACANMGVCPAETLIDPVLAAQQLQLPFESAKVYAVTREKPRKKYSRPQIESALRAELDRRIPSHQSVTALAEHLGVPPGMLYFHAPDLAKQLARKISAIERRRRHDKRRSLERSAERILLSFKAQGMKMTRKPFVAELMRRNRCGIVTAKNLFPIAMARVMATG